MKKLTLLTIAMIFTLALSACGASAAQTPIEPATATEAVSQPTQVPAATETLVVTDTAVPATEAASSTFTETPASASAPSGVSFANDIQPILNANCIKCHGVERVKEGLDLQTYDNLMAGSNNGSVIEPGNASGSYLVELINNGKMPNRGDHLSAEDIKLIEDWINQGALNN